jgi:uncharacterized protein YggE
MLKKWTLIAALTLVHAAASAAELPAYPFIHTSGVGSTYVIPDVGEIDFEIVAVDADPEVARALIETRLTQIRAAGDGAGIAPDDIAVRDVRREIRKYPNAEPGMVNHELRCSVHIKVSNLTSWAALVSPLLNLPNLDGFMTEFTATDREKVESALLADAIKMARRRAEGMAAGAGKKLGEVAAMTSGQLSNLTRSMGLSPQDVYGRNGGDRGQAAKKDLLTIVTLKFAQTVDVIFRIK